jgi:hypothetical protein
MTTGTLYHVKLRASAGFSAVPRFYTARTCRVLLAGAASCAVSRGSAFYSRNILLIVDITEEGFMELPLPSPVIELPDPVSKEDLVAAKA